MSINGEPKLINSLRGFPARCLRVRNQAKHVHRFPHKADISKSSTIAITQTQEVIHIGQNPQANMSEGGPEMLHKHPHELGEKVQRNIPAKGEGRTLE